MKAIFICLLLGLLKRRQSYICISRGDGTACTEEYIILSPWEIRPLWLRQFLPSSLSFRASPCSPHTPGRRQKDFTIVKFEQDHLCKQMPPGPDLPRQGCSNLGQHVQLVASIYVFKIFPPPVLLKTWLWEYLGPHHLGSQGYSSTGTRAGMASTSETHTVTVEPCVT